MAITIGNDAKGSSIHLGNGAVRSTFIPQPNWGLDRETPMVLLLLRGLIEQAAQTTNAAVKANPALVVEAYFNSCLSSSIGQVIGSETVDDDTFYFQELCGYWHTIVFMLEYKKPEETRSYWQLSCNGIAIRQAISPQAMINKWCDLSDNIADQRDQEILDGKIDAFQELLKR